MHDEKVTWTEVSARLRAACNYWLSTTTPSGTPHAAPVLGLVDGETLYLYSEPSTVKARNLARPVRATGPDPAARDGCTEFMGVR
jgi:Pyridoxamine 5'-phosphate oxidase